MPTSCRRAHRGGKWGERFPWDLGQKRDRPSGVLLVLGSRSYSEKWERNFSHLAPRTILAQRRQTKVFLCSGSSGQKLFSFLQVLHFDVTYILFCIFKRNAFLLNSFKVLFSCSDLEIIWNLLFVCNMEWRFFFNFLQKTNFPITIY